MRRSALFVLIVLSAIAVGAETPGVAPLGMAVPPLAGDPAVRYDYDIVYVRVPIAGRTSTFSEVAQPRKQQPGGDLVLRHPTGKEVVLVDVDPPRTIVDPMVSPDGRWVYYSLFYDGERPEGADIYKVNVQTKEVVQLTFQEWTPNRRGQPRRVPTAGWCSRPTETALRRPIPVTRRTPWRSSSRSSTRRPATSRRSAT